VVKNCPNCFFIREVFTLLLFYLIFNNNSNSSGTPVYDRISASGQKMEGFKGRKFFAREPSGLVLPAAAGGGLKISVGVFSKISSNFNQKIPPIFRIRILGDCCLAPPKAGLGFGKEESSCSIKSIFIFVGKSKICIIMSEDFLISPNISGLL